MRLSLRAGIAALTLGLVAAGTTTAPATAGGKAGHPPGKPGPSEVAVVAEGLSNPFGIDKTSHGLFVAESGAGQVTLVRRDGSRRAIVKDVPGVAGVTAFGRHVWSVVGGPGPDGDVPGGDYGPATVLRTDLHTGRTKVIASLLDYELKRNPDGQPQFAPDGTPYDALSNPFSVTLTPKGLLVADGGANAVLRVDPWSGRVSTFYVPRNVISKPCLAEGAQSNPGVRGCDSVPTGVAWFGGSVFVSTLGSEQPGAGRIYQLDARKGWVKNVWKGLDGPTGVAVTKAGVVYSQVFGGGEAGPPGRLVLKTWRGERTLDLPFPTGLTTWAGSLYSTSNSLAAPGAGLVVRVPLNLFS